MDELELPEIDVVASIYHRKQVEQAMEAGDTLTAEDGANLMVEWAELPAAQQQAIKEEIEAVYDAIEEASQLDDEGDEEEEEEDTSTTGAAA